MRGPAVAAAEVVLGLRENRGQFALLLLINGFVGAMVGMERALLPLLAEREFGVASRASILSFVLTFGLVKALANLAAGGLADRWGRRRTLLVGWLAALPVAPMIAFAPSWGWIVAANVLLGVNQGLCWSAAIIMKVDLVGPARRGLAIGLNEASGYVAVSLAALVSGYLAATHGLRPAPFVIGVVAALAGLACSFLAHDTQRHADMESAMQRREGGLPLFREVFARVSWRDRSLFAASQAGLANNLNDGVSWGLFPLWFAAAGASLSETAGLVAIYPAVWGVTQLATGPLSDRLGRKTMIAAGMAMQAAALFMVAAARATTVAWTIAMIALGVGTALVYPTLLGAVSDHAHPSWRASAIGVYRLWRDLGYAAGAIVAGIAADALGIASAIRLVAGLTLFSGVVFALAYEEATP